jgi:hypothetical protein
MAAGQNKVILNGFPKDSVRFYIGFQKVHEQFNYLQAAQKFNTNKAGILLQQVDLHRAIVPVNGGEVSIGEPASTTFLLNIYDVDSITGAPSRSIIKEPLTIKNGSSSMIKIDLRKYKIIIPGKTFFVGVEWIFNDRNQRIMNNAFNAPSFHYADEKQYYIAELIYQPFIGMVKNQKTTSDAWMMTQDRKWINYTHNLPYMTDLSITSHIIIK